MPVQAKASPSNPPTSAIVAQRLRQAILTGEMKGGARVRQDAIAVHYSVSQVSAREAFQILVGEGLLRAEPRRGVAVAPLSADEAREITDLRVLLETDVLGRANANLMSADLARARTILDQLDGAMNVDDILDLNARFHTTLYAPSGRPKTLAMIETLRLNFERYLRVTWEETSHLRHSQREHHALLRLCAKRDIKGAAAALRGHILATGETIIRRLARR